MCNLCEISREYGYPPFPVFELRRPDGTLAIGQEEVDNDGRLVKREGVTAFACHSIAQEHGEKIGARPVLENRLVPLAWGPEAPNVKAFADIAYSLFPRAA